MTVNTLTSLAEFKTALESKKLIIVDFYADWCGPCKRLAPEMEKLAEKNRETVEFYKVNVDNVPEISNLYEIQVLPTVLYFKDSVQMHKTVGANVMDICAAILKIC